MQIITFYNTELHLKEHSTHEFLLSNKEVALGYGITANNLNKHKSEHADELIEGKHWLRVEVQTRGGKQRVIHWTKKGIVRLGFFIKSENAKKFRDWAEDYIVNSNNNLDYQLQRENIELKRTLNRLLYNTEDINRLKQENLNYYEQLDTAKRKLQQIKNIL